MNSKFLCSLAVWLVSACVIPLIAADRFVSPNGSHAAPFIDWASAATNIQDAIDAASDGDTIWVTNGVYSTGGKVMAGNLTNRVAIDKAVTVRSVNGPWVTSIIGAGATNGNAAVRCAWLTNGATLHGFTIQNGATRTSGDPLILTRGGGIWCASSNATVMNCVIRSNTAAFEASAIFRGRAWNSLISSNHSIGATIVDAVLNNCTVVSNSGSGLKWSTGGGVAGTNCIVYYNTSSALVNNPAIYNSCVSSQPINGTGNFTTAPALFADGIQLTSSSPCRGAGLNSAAGTDIFGKPWANPPSVGCAEWNDAPTFGTAQVRVSIDPPGLLISIAHVNGTQPRAFQWLHNGSPVQDDNRTSGANTNALLIQHPRETDQGAYQLVASNQWQIATSAVAMVSYRFVDVANSNPTPPYTNWATAATRIQDAIDAAQPGEVILVADGIYEEGGKVMESDLTNRVAIYKQLYVTSVNGAASTTIKGAPGNGSFTNNAQGVRCVWMTNNAVLSGFTVTRGSTRAQSFSGGGVSGSFTNPVVLECVITNNLAGSVGGGVFLVRAISCQIIGNRASQGGGASGSAIVNCILSGNHARTNGGGAFGSSLRNSAIVRNSSSGNGAGISGGTAINCTIVGNTIGAPSAGAAHSSKLTNCVVWGNHSGGFASSTNHVNCTISYSCSTPLPSGTGNIAVDPKLLADGFHLAGDSPVLNAGNAALIQGTDIDGRAWTSAAMGCDAWNSEPTLIGSISAELGMTFPANLSIRAGATGAEPLTLFWLKDGAKLSNGTEFSNADTSTLQVQNFGPSSAGLYGLVVSNSFGVITSEWTRVSVHCADANATSPVPPYSSWATAATTIQDAVDIAEPGAFVLVTNGIYNAGGRTGIDALMTRLIVEDSVTVSSVSGPDMTVIQGARDPITTNGSTAVRGARLSGGALLNGFTIRNGATMDAGNDSTRGGGVFADAISGIVNCRLVENSAIEGGGIFGGNTANSIIENNQAQAGGGCAGGGRLVNSLVRQNKASIRGGGILNPGEVRHCTIIGNSGGNSRQEGGGLHVDWANQSITINSIIAGNWDLTGMPNDYYSAAWNSSIASSCVSYQTDTLGAGVIVANPQFTDEFHLATTSPCRGTANPAHATGIDLDGEPWASPPSMGCDEVVEDAIDGPLSVSLESLYGPTNFVAGRYTLMRGQLTGRATRLTWDLGDGSSVTNVSHLVIGHVWTNVGVYSITFTAFNTDHPNGVSVTRAMNVDLLQAPTLIFSISDSGPLIMAQSQAQVIYNLESATNLTSPTWETRGFYMATNSLLVIRPLISTTNDIQFFRLKAD